MSPIEVHVQRAIIRHCDISGAVERRIDGQAAVAVVALQDRTGEADGRFRGIMAADLLAGEADVAFLIGPFDAAGIRTLIGAEHHENGAMFYRTIACLPALTGSWRERGGGRMRHDADAYDRSGRQADYDTGLSGDRCRIADDAAGDLVVLRGAR